VKVYQDDVLEESRDLLADLGPCAPQLRMIALTVLTNKYREWSEGVLQMFTSASAQGMLCVEFEVNDPFFAKEEE
jgi:hypothetical protein